MNEFESLLEAFITQIPDNIKSKRIVLSKENMEKAKELACVKHYNGPDFIYKDKIVLSEVNG